MTDVNFFLGKIKEDNKDMVIEHLQLLLYNYSAGRQCHSFTTG